MAILKRPDYGIVKVTVFIFLLLYHYLVFFYISGKKQLIFGKKLSKIYFVVTVVRPLTYEGDGAGQLSVPGRPTNSDYSRARAYCACSKCGWRLFWYFSRLSSLL